MAETTTGPQKREDEWVVDNPTLRQFIETVNEIRRSSPDPVSTIEAIRPHFAN